MNSNKAYLWAGGPHSDQERTIQDIKKAFNSWSCPNPKIAYIGTAHLDDSWLLRYITGYLKKAGAKEVRLVPIVSQYDEKEAKYILDSSDAVFLSGGEVEDGIVWLHKRGIDVYLKKLFEEGKPFMGVSAGAIMMGQHWVHWDKEGDNSTASLFDCLNFLPFTFDAHGEGEKWTELRCAVRLLGPGQKGYGLVGTGFFLVGEDGSIESLHEPPLVYVNRNGKAFKE
jgi:peptidase E